MRTLLEMSPDQLDDLFRASPAGDMPDGEATGIAIISHRLIDFCFAF
ncbi:hypothetical protein [Cupriavidus sp. PET2-C1]